MQKKERKFFIFTIKKATVVFGLALAVFCVAAGAATPFLLDGTAAATPLGRPIVVLDAGHGGIDRGVTGRGGLTEAEFNLDMAYLLKGVLEEGGFSVVLTRTGREGLYGDDADNFKRADMKKRKEIVQSVDPDLFLSIHANKFPSSERRGAQVFFDDFNPAGKALAESIQQEVNRLNEKYVGRTFAALSGDYYMLKCTHAPSALIECGFLSNEEDEKLLSDKSYCLLLSEAIYAGMVGLLEKTAK